MMEPSTLLSSQNNSTLPSTSSSQLNKLHQDQFCSSDWQTEKLNFIPLRGSWFANSEADFDLEEEINKFLVPQSTKKVMLLMGDSGAGKSLYTQGLASKLWQNFSAQSPIPIWISLPSLKDPVNRAIEESLERYGVNKDQIEELRKTRSFIFILDAYDEIRCEQNLYQTNNLDKWNAKIIITCRREYLYHKDNYKLFFAPFIEDKIQYTQYEEIYIRPFNTNQIQTYVQQYIKTQAMHWKEPEKYQKAIDEISGLKELIKTPFMLKITMEVLPQIVEKYATQNMQDRKKVTQAALYDVFVEQWFIRQEHKLKQAKQIKEDEDIKPEFWAYVKELALEMHKANLTQIIYNPNEESDLFSTDVKENIWAKFFTPKNPRIELLRTACLVRETSQHHYAFIHSSLLEYFLTRNLYDHIIIQSTELTTNIAQTIQKTNNPQTNQMIPAATSSSSVTKNQNDKIHQNSKEDYFNQRLIVKEDNTLQFLADRVTENKSFKKLLFDRIFSSRKNPGNKIAASNAITVLNRAKIAFSGLNLSGINIPNADLTTALLHHTNLSGSDMSGVILHQSNLRSANLKDCNLSEIDLGQQPLIEYPKEVYNIYFLRDGKHLLIRSSENVSIWDYTSNKKNFEIKGKFVAYGQTGKYMVIKNTEAVKRVCLWDFESMKEIDRPVKWQPTMFDTAAFSPDETLIVSSGDKDDRTIRLWDTKNFQQIGKLIKEHTDEINTLAFSSDGKFFASGGKDNAVCLWQTSNQALLAKMQKHRRWIIKVVFSPDDKIIASCSIDKTITLWNIQPQIKQEFQTEILTEPDMVFCIAFHPNGKMLASGNKDNAIRLWSIEEKKLICQPLIGHNASIQFLSFNTNGTILASSSDDQTIRLWSVDKQIQIRYVPFHVRSIWTIAFQPGTENYVSGGDDGYIQFWSLNENVPVRQALNYNNDYVNTLAINSNGKILACGCYEGPIQLWSLETFQPIGNLLEGHKSMVTRLIFTPDSELLISHGNDQKIIIWDIKTKQQLGVPIKINCNLNNDMALSPNGKLLAYGDEKIYFCELLTRQFYGKPLERDEKHYLISHITHDLAFNSDGTLLVSGSEDKDVCIWSVQSYQLIGQPLKHAAIVNRVIFSTDDKQVFAGTMDGIYLWDVATQSCINKIYMSLNWINSFCISDNGMYLLFATIKHIGIFKRINISNSEYQYCMVKYTGISHLDVENLVLKGVTGLSEENYRLLTQLGAKQEQLSLVKPLEQDVNDSTSFRILRDKNTPSLFTPAIESTKDKQHKKDKQAKKSIDNKDRSRGDERCLIM